MKQESHMVKGNIPGLMVLDIEALGDSGLRKDLVFMKIYLDIGIGVNGVVVRSADLGKRAE
jgi:hypothetical protein